MSVQRIFDDKGHGGFFIYDDGKKIAEMIVGIKEKVMTVYHTEVETEAEGKGFAKQLLEDMVSYAREEKLKVVPQCPFVHAQFKRHEEEYRNIWQHT